MTAFIKVKHVYVTFKIHFKWSSCILFTAVVNNGAQNMEWRHLLEESVSIPLGLQDHLGYVVILFKSSEDLQHYFPKWC